MGINGDKCTGYQVYGVQLMVTSCPWYWHQTACVEAPPFHGESGGGGRKNEVRPLVGISAEFPSVLGHCWLDDKKRYLSDP